MICNWVKFNSWNIKIFFNSSDFIIQLKIANLIKTLMFNLKIRKTKDSQFVNCNWVKFNFNWLLPIKNDWQLTQIVGAN